MIRFNDLVFDDELLTARRDDETVLRFTRQERVLLRQFTERPGRLMTRDRLARLLTRGGDGVGERNVDFVVNRLRKRLGDKAHAPRFIATQYGEGYVWIAKSSEPPPSDTFLVMGPMYGLPARPGREQVILKTIAAGFDNMLGRHSRVIYAPQWKADVAAPANVSHTLEASFYEDGAVLHAAFALRRHPTRLIVRAIRSVFGVGDTEAEIGRIVSETRAAMWTHLASPPATPQVAPTDLPLEMRVHDTALMLAQRPDRWCESEMQLVRARSEHPGDPVLTVLWGVHLYMELIRAPGADRHSTPQAWTEIEDAIEVIALDNLAAVRRDPLLVLAIAKLLLFVGRGHFELVRKLVDQTFAESTAFAATFTMQAQIHMYCGAFAQAFRFIDLVLELSEPGSDFQLFLLILKCIALTAAGDRAGLEQTTDQVYSMRPSERRKIGLLFADPLRERLPPDLEALLNSISATTACNMLNYLFNMATRFFKARRHRDNVMAGLMAHLVRRFGADFMPARIAEAVGCPPSQSPLLSAETGRDLKDSE
jgi:DNA-binding winged helix-turn-helix (wHTH) protein